jgi:hypothetical protein
VTHQIGWHQPAGAPIDYALHLYQGISWVLTPISAIPVRSSRWLPFAGQHGGAVSSRTTESGWAWFWPWPLVPGRWVLLGRGFGGEGLQVSIESKRTPNRCVSGRICSIPHGCLDALLAVEEHEGEAQGHRRPRFGLLDVRGF